MKRPLSLAFGMTGLTFALVANGCASWDCTTRR